MRTPGDIEWRKAELAHVYFDDDSTPVRAGQTALEPVDSGDSNDGSKLYVGNYNSPLEQNTVLYWFAL